MRVIACLALCVVARGAIAQAPKVEPLPIRESVEAHSFSLFAPVLLSPDGRWITYTLVDPRRSTTEPDPRFSQYRRSGVSFTNVGADVWIADTRGGGARNVTGSVGNSWNASWSPDGRQLAFFSDRSGTAALWVWQRETNQMRQVSQALARSTTDAPLWTPDGTRVIIPVLAEGLTNESAAERLAARPRTSRGAADDSSTAIVYRSPAAARQFGPVVAADTMAGQSMAVQAPVVDMAVIDVATGKLQRLTRGVTVGTYALSPDGRELACLVSKPQVAARSQQPVADLTVVPVAGGTPRVVASNIPVGFGGVPSFTWSPDSKQIAYAETGPATRPRLGVVALAGGTPRTFATGGSIPEAGGSKAIDRGADAVPLWNDSGSAVTVIVADTIWSVRLRDGAIRSLVPGGRVLGAIRRQHASSFAAPDGGRSMLLITRDLTTQEERIVAMDMETGRATPLMHGNVHLGGYSPGVTIDMSRDGTHVIFVREDVRSAPDIWVSDMTFHAPVRVTHISPVFDQYALGSARLISWHLADGTLCYGALLLPPSHRDGQRHPLVIDVYAGSFLSKKINAFGLGSGVATENHQLLATRGFAVLLPDIPLGPGSPMRDIGAAIGAAADRAVELGYADAARIGEMGQSSGGYSTLAAIVTSPRYAAAAERAGPANLTSVYGIFDERGGNFGVGWSEEGQGRMGGTLWEQRDRYINNSPIFFLDKVQTPLLIIHGTSDAAVPTSETAQIFVGLRRLGKTVEYARYVGEAHWEGTWSYHNQIDYWTRVLRWFDTYLKEGMAR
jgi:dipeptidyl aminopeptidase/acylaminoacyl peptidase